ncbi:outer membrane beta-barrel protein [Aquisalimonas sp. APHAB1-3]|uniref:outer membrane beta-barrel protein n=3 Tax=unclassified Aquisalimonas TaxID=2644645 RepID=UPI003AAC0C5E
MLRACPCSLLVLVLMALPAPGQVQAAESDPSGWTVELETGGLWFSRNRARIPSDTGTTVDLRDLTGSGGDPYVRLYVGYEFNERHSVRLNLAPVRETGTGTLDREVEFDGETFEADTPTRASYKFNTYRLTYRWMFHRDADWDLGVGAALLVRDAHIELRQDNVRARNEDLGFVPLLHLYGGYHLTDRTSLVLDLEGAAAPQGRALDLAVQVRHALPSGWQVFGGYRTLEGGADNSSVYTFAWLHHVSVGIGYRF